MIHVAAGLRRIGIAVDAGAGEVGAAGDHDRLINDHEFVVHQSAAAAAIGGVIQQGNSSVLQQCNGIAAMGFLRCRDAITIAIGQSIQSMPALTFSLREMAHLLLAPRRAVVVLQNDLHSNAALMGADESHGNAWQCQLLHGQLQALLG